MTIYTIITNTVSHATVGYT